MSLRVAASSLASVALTLAAACGGSSSSNLSGLSGDDAGGVDADAQAPPDKDARSPDGDAPGADGSAPDGGPAACAAAHSPGFAAQPAAYAVPAPRCKVSFDRQASAGGALGYATLDLTGDARPDLVVFQDACDATVGKTHWDLYPGAPSGFAAQPAPFSVPAARCKTSFDASASSGGNVRYATMDLTGDAAPDLVVLSDACDATVGKTHWDVYTGGAAGFAAQPVAFALPAARCQTSFDASASVGGKIGYAVVDLTAGGGPELVVYQDACDATVGKTHWDLYAWSASGFAAQPAPFAVPAGRCNASFDALASGGLALSYSLLDVTGDRQLDLVVVRDGCDATVGQTHWDVYGGGGAAGFAPQPAAFSVPAGRCKATFDALASGAVSLGWATIDLTGAGQPDLAVYRDGCDATVGATHWDVYRWSPSGFAAQPSSFAVPAGRCKASFDATGSGSGPLAYGFASVVDTCRTGLAVTSDACDATVGKTHWDVYGQQ